MNRFVQHDVSGIFCMIGSLFFSTHFLVFTLALISMLLLAITELVSSTFKTSPLGWLTSRLPKFVHRVVIKTKINELPIFTLIILSLLSIGLIGYGMQFLWFAIYDHFASAWVIMVPVILLSILFTIFLSHWLSQLAFQQPATTLSATPNLLGRIATVCGGIARPGVSSHARVRDELGQLHYIEVEPEFGELLLHSDVILVSKQQHIYLAKTLPKDNQLLSH